MDNKIGKFVIFLLWDGHMLASCSENYSMF